MPSVPDTSANSAGCRRRRASRTMARNRPSGTRRQSGARSKAKRLREMTEPGGNTAPSRASSCWKCRTSVAVGTTRRMSRRPLRKAALNSRKTSEVLPVPGAPRIRRMGLPEGRTKGEYCGTPLYLSTASDIFPTMPRRSEAPTCQPGYTNRNRQTVLRPTGKAGTDYGQYVYVLKCGMCGNEYGANGSDCHLRKCPECQFGAKGLPY